MISETSSVTSGGHRETDAITTPDGPESDLHWVSLGNPDDPDDMPIFEGPADAAGELLIPGSYDGVDINDRPVRVTVQSRISGAPTPPPAG